MTTEKWDPDIEFDTGCHRWEIDGRTGFTLVALGPEGIDPIAQCEVWTQEKDNKRSAVWLLRALHVGEKYRRLGVASQLLRRVILMAYGDCDCEAISLSVQKDNEIVPLYELQGFQICWEWDEEIGLVYTW